MADAKAQLEILKRETAQKLASARERVKRTGLEQMMVRKGTILGTAALYGTLNRMNVPITLGGFPVKLAVAGLSLIGEATTKGAVQSVFGGVADTSLAIWVERSITTGSVIAGDGYVDDDGDGDDMRDGAAPPEGDGAEL